jgi:hypothetical protein
MKTLGGVICRIFKRINGEIGMGESRLGTLPSLRYFFVGSTRQCFLSGLSNMVATLFARLTSTTDTSAIDSYCAKRTLATSLIFSMDASD